MFTPIDVSSAEAGQVDPRSRVKYVAESATLQVYERIVIASATATITLPPVSKCTGGMFVIRSTTADNVTISPDNTDSTISYNGAFSGASVVLTDIGAFAVLISTGEHWIGIGVDLAA